MGETILRKIHANLNAKNYGEAEKLLKILLGEEKRNIQIENLEYKQLHLLVRESKTIIDAARNLLTSLKNKEYEELFHESVTLVEREKYVLLYTKKLAMELGYQLKAEIDKRKRPSQLTKKKTTKRIRKN
jgi:hypothetical protein